MVERKDGIKYNKLGHDGTKFTLNGERLNYVTKFEYVTDVEDPKGFSKVKLELYVDDSELWEEQNYEFIDTKYGKYKVEK